MSNVYETGRIVAGRYRIASLLSQGGMGAVYLAQQTSLGRDVAVKVILRDSDDAELLARFDVEARAVCQLRHPNIITYHDYGRDDGGNPFLVMEFLAGFPGNKLVASGARRRSVAEIVHVVVQVCSALSEAHKKGIVHRDLKWSNVMIVPQADDPLFAKLIDFGIVKVGRGGAGDLRQRTLTGTGMLLGTPDYMSPEVITGMEVDGRADQYALAIMLFEALEGARPFQAATMFELFLKQVQELPPQFEEAVPIMEQYPLLDGVIRRALEKHPDDRYPDIASFRTALIEAVRDDGVGRNSGLGPGVGSGGSGARPGAQAGGDRGRPQGRSAATQASPRAGEVARGTRASRDLGRPATTRPRLMTGEPPSALVAPGGRRRVWIWAALGVGILGLIVTVALLVGRGGHAVETPPSVAAADAGGNADASAVAAANDGVAAPEAALEVVVAVEAVPPEVVVAAEPEVSTPSDTAVAVAETVAATPEVVAEAPDATVAPDVVVAADTTPTHVARRTQKLTILANPWARVSINGKPVGSAPGVFEAPVGSVSVTCENPTKGRRVLSVRVSADKPAAVNCFDPP